MLKFEMLDVASSNISQIGYLEGQKTLRVRFESGSLSDYFPVTLEEFTELKNAKSKGKHFNYFIKRVKEHTPVTEETEKAAGAVLSSVRNPTEKSLKFNQNKGRLEQASERINTHVKDVHKEVTEALRNTFNPFSQD